MRQEDEQSRMLRQSNVSRAPFGQLPGLNGQQTRVLQAVGHVALESRDRRLTLYDVIERLASLSISRRQVEQALVKLQDCGYVYVDDAPENADVILHLMPEGLDQYCTRLIPDYRRISKDILKVACQDEGIDMVELAHRVGRQELLVEHVLTTAEKDGLVRLKRRGENYIVVETVMPYVKRWLSGAA